MSKIEDESIGGVAVGGVFLLYQSLEGRGRKCAGRYLQQYAVRLQRGRRMHGKEHELHRQAVQNLQERTHTRHHATGISLPVPEEERQV